MEHLILKLCEDIFLTFIFGGDSDWSIQQIQ